MNKSDWIDKCEEWHVINFLLTHVNGRPRLSMLWCRVPLLGMAGEVIGPLRDGKGCAGCRAPHDAAGYTRREHTKSPWGADGMGAGPLLFILRGLRRLGGGLGRRRGLKMEVCHLWEGERHLSGVAHGALYHTAVSACCSLKGRRGPAVLQSTVRGADVLGLLLWVTLNVGPWLWQGGDWV